MLGWPYFASAAAFYQNYPIITAAIFSFPQVKLWIIVDYLFIYLLFIFGQHSSDQQSLQVAFDVYQPGVNFKKTDPGPPHFCITVCRYELTRVSEIRTNLLERPPIHNTKMSHLKPFTENLS